MGADAAAVGAEALGRARRLNCRATLLTCPTGAGFGALPILRGCFVPLTLLRDPALARASIGADGDPIASELVSNRLRAALPAGVLDAPEYFGFGQRGGVADRKTDASAALVVRRVLGGQLVYQRSPKRRVADEILAAVLAAFFKKIGSDRHRNPQHAEPAVDADLVAAHRLSAQGSGQGVDGAGYVRVAHAR